VCVLELPAGQAKFPLLKAAKLVKDNKPVLILAITEGTGLTTDRLVSISYLIDVLEVFSEVILDL
jgi:hypothetical protein